MFLSWVLYAPNSGTSGYLGDVVTLPQNVQIIVYVFPRALTDLSVLRFTVKRAEINFAHF